MEKIKNNQLLKSFLLIAITLTILVSAFAMFINTDNKNTVLADSVDNNYVFNGSTILMNVAYRRNNQYPVYMTKYQFVLKPNEFVVNYTVFTGLETTSPVANSYTSNFSYNTDGNEHSIALNYGSGATSTTYYSVNSDFNRDVAQIHIYTSEDTFYYYTNIDYIDKADNIFHFRVMNGSKSTISASDLLTERRYYLITDFTNNDYYDNGYSVGYNTGVDDGYSSGYADGLSVGNSQGYTTGYNDGLAEANDYTFLGLIGAVIDAPIKAFYGLFNFEILGTNIASFITAILTLAITIFVIRFALGKGE